MLQLYKNTEMLHFGSVFVSSETDGAFCPTSIICEGHFVPHSEFEGHFTAPYGDTTFNAATQFVISLYVWHVDVQ